MSSRMGGNIHRAAVMEVAIDSENTEFISDGDTTFTAEVPTVSHDPNLPTESGTINITDSALMATVIGSKDTVVDSRGTKLSIKIPEEEAGEPEPGYPDMPQQESVLIGCRGGTGRQNSGLNAKGSIVINAISGSSDTQVNMSGARIRIKKKKGSRQKNKPYSLQSGTTNMDNSVAVGFIANSERTEVDLRGADIKIE